MESKDTEQLLSMMNVFYASPALLHHTPEPVLRRVISDCLSGEKPVECFVCVEDEDILGYTIASRGYSTEYGGISIMIEDLYVAPDARKRGVGRVLLKHVETTYGGEAVRLRLEVEKDNTRAVSLYRNCGFEFVDYAQMHKIIE